MISKNNHSELIILVILSLFAVSISQQVSDFSHINNLRHKRV